MSKIFYDHLIVREEIISELDLHELDSDVRNELEGLIDEILNHNVLNLILNHLPKDNHQEFIDRFVSNPSDETLLVFVEERVPVDIRSQIKNHSSKVKDEIKNEISKARTHKK